MKEFASALRSRLVVSVVPASMGGSRIYDATLAGKRVGSIRVHDRFARDLFGNITGKKTPKISRSDVDERFRGMGIGKKLYSEVIKREGRIMSDSSVSGEARRVYESLKKNKNIKIRTFPATETQGELVGRNGVYQQRPPGLSNGFGGRPVFAVQWKGRKERALSAKLRLRELAAASLRLVEFRMVAPVSVSKLGDAESRKVLVKSIRRFLEKQKGVDRNAVRAAMGAKPMRGEITTRKQSIMDTRRAFLDRAANKKQNADLVEPGWQGKPTLKLIADFRDPDFEQKAARLDRLRRLAERASKNKKYQALTGNAPGYVNKRNATPRLAMVNDEMALLTYRGIAEGGSYPVLKRKLSRPRDGWQSPKARTPVRHTLRASGGLASQPTKASGAAMSMTTNPAKADEFASGAQGAVGVYGVQLRKLLKEAREGNLSGKPGSKIAIVNKEFPSEREISQATGGNLLAVRKYKYNAATGMRERA